jgi:serine/threonine protein phosphatase PrpC
MAAQQVRPSLLAFHSAGLTHVGQRALNEDSFLERTEVGLWAVADGMGGHESGEVASRLIVEALAAVTSFSSGYAFLDEVCASLMRVNGELIARAAALPPGAVIGSTAVVLLAFENHYACVWAGDSRAYLLRGGELMRITHDHSLVQELIDSGVIDPAEARTHHRGNVITRAVGAAPTLSLDMHNNAVEPGDRFLLCSDGLTGVVEDEEIARIIGQSPLDAAADRLLATALERGARDNVTVLLVAAD